MAAPTAPTLTTLVAEALKKAGNSNPSSDLTDRAEDKWMEEIKADIWGKVQGKKLKPLLTSRITVLTDGQPQYDRASDFEEDDGKNAMELMWGDKAGTADAGSTTSITFPSTANYTDDIVGRRLVITSGTGQGGIAWITAYNTSTRVATLGPALTTAPASGSGYLIVEASKPLTQRSLERVRQDGTLKLRGEPAYFVPLESGGSRSFLLAPVPYRNISGLSFVLQEWYYVHLLKADLDGDVVERTYLEWRNVYEAGLIWKSYIDDEDDQKNVQFGIYQRELKRLIGNDAYGNNQSDLHVRVLDY
jgi:hypothetical protein